ncbi:MAG TPA: murein biosynthesis integral membrane protein MurJ [Ktedonobacteraceae bacterium]|nr:murein biosynthesis integral membrane protein MurJ [Ktedonobacteraceae bacterium]
MANEGQQPPVPPQGPPEQQTYYGWQYDGEEPGQIAGQPPVPPAPAPPPYPPQQYSPAYVPPNQAVPRQPGPPMDRGGPLPQPLPPPNQGPVPYPSPQQNRGGVPKPLPPQYQQPLQDMGTSLGYGQGMEYQYFNAPQPSQPMRQLRQARLQQLREERMRNNQRRMRPDITTLLQRKVSKPPFNGASPSPVLPSQMSPAMPLPPSEVSPSLIRPPAPPPGLQRSPSGPPIEMQDQGQPAAAPAQDTGMIQKVRIGRASMILQTSFIASRILGLLRSSLFAYIFGTTIISDAFLQAFLVPDLIFNIVAGGALSSAFIPVFTHYMIGERDEKSAWHIANSALNLALAIMMGLALIAIIFAPWLVPIYNPGVPPQELSLIISLTRIMLLQSIILGGGVILNSVLNAQQNFMLPAIGTVLYNVGLITGLLPGFVMALHGQRGGAASDTAIYFATWGVVLGAILQVAVQVPGTIKVGMHYRFTFDWRHPGVIQVGRQMVPRIINAAMLYFSTFVDRSLILIMAAGITVGMTASQASNATQGSITQYYQALQLVLLPLGIFGMAVSTAAFPTLAENVTRGRLDRVRTIITDTLRSILFLSIPSSVGLIVLALPIIQVLLEHGAYSLDDAIHTSFPLVFFAIGLTALSAVEILTRSFYALRDSKTPVIISIGQFIFKIALSLILINIAVYGAQWGLGALALSTSIAGTLEAFVLLWVLQERIGGLQLRALANFAARVFFASAIMGIAVLLLRFVLDLILPTGSLPVLGTESQQSLGVIGTGFAIIKLLIELAAGLFIYIRATRYLGIEEFWNQGPVKRLLDRFKLSWL